MREVNFSIPSSNKAAVGITTALYDRRALDCTSTLPLVNSLNNLAYLTTSSGRIRDILCIDGGIERLVCILKEGRSKEEKEMWKWNLAFQCIVNIGVRGSENVRTRVVEADMVPVIATILDNYFQVMEKRREKEESEKSRKCPFKSSSRAAHRGESHEHRSSRSRRHAPPPPISIPEGLDRNDAEARAAQTTPTITAAHLSLSSPPERTTFASPATSRRTHAPRSQASSTVRVGGSRPVDPPLAAMPLPRHRGIDHVRPVRDVDRLPSMVSTPPAESSRPQSPTTPGGPPPRRGSPSAGPRPRRRPSIRHQLSMSGSDDDAQLEESVSDESITVDGQREPVVGIQSDIVMQDIAGDDGLLQPRDNAVTINVPDVSGADDETFNITHRSTADGSIANPATTPTPARMDLAPAPVPAPANNLPTPNLPQAFPPPMMWYPSRALQSQRAMAGINRPIPASLPRDEDVLMSLQLLAYVSKYCNLRSYFQKSHLVPRLKISEDDIAEVLGLDQVAAGKTQEELDEDWDNEFVVKPDELPYNIFPLIEKFTAKSSSRYAPAPAPTTQQNDMQYWAGVVMRNLCRKDDSRGGIRQCAYWKCGKWEEYTRQFAKCRRCRRTKYCSKECQKGAWGSHRFWCVAADDGRDGEASASGDRHHHRHYRSHHHHH